MTSVWVEIKTPVRLRDGHLIRELTTARCKTDTPAVNTQVNYRVIGVARERLGGRRRRVAD